MQDSLIHIVQFYYKFHIIFMSYDRFVDDRLLTSRDALNKVQLRIKLMEIDEGARDFSQRYGQRILIKKGIINNQAFRYGRNRRERNGHRRY